MPRHATSRQYATSPWGLFARGGQVATGIANFSHYRVHYSSLSRERLDRALRDGAGKHEIGRLRAGVRTIDLTDFRAVLLADGGPTPLPDPDAGPELTAFPAPSRRRLRVL